MDGVYWRAYVAAAPSVVVVADVDGTILSGDHDNPRFGPLVGRKLWDFTAPDAKARIQDKLASVVATKKTLVYSSASTRGDGTSGFYEVSVIPVVVDGRVERILWSAMDITDRTAVQRALEASERRARALVEHGSDCITLVDETGRINWASPGLLSNLGYAAEEVVGQRSLDFIHPDDRAAAFGAGRGSAAGAVTDATVRVRAKDGSYHYFEGTSHNLLGDPSVHSIVNNHRDVTTRRALEDQLRHSQKMEAIGLLAGGVAHDFNNLLAIIVGWSGLAARHLPEGHPVQQHLLEVEEATRRGSELTRKLLAFSRKQIIKPTALDVRSSVDDFLRIIQRIVGEDVAIEVERAEVPLVVRADPTQLEQVLMNLCANARHAMPSGGTMRIATREADFDEASLETRPWARAGTFAEIAVSDTGVGMDEATRARVFEPFFTTKPEGTGLGLALVYGIVEQHGGFMRVESAPGEGTTFHAFLPRTDEPAPRSTSPRSGAMAARGGSEAVLLAEDEPSLRALMEVTLAELGYRVTATRDGEEAAREYERQNGAFDLVILDVVMPRLGGRDAYDRMRALKPAVKVIFITGYAPASTQLRDLLAGTSLPLLEKPFTPAALAATVRETIDERRRG